MESVLNPVIHLGIDIGYKRDTSAVVGTYRDLDRKKYGLFCHKIWEPPVHIPDVTDYVIRILENERVGGIWFDPMQYAAETQRLRNDGYGHLLREVSQSGSYMIGIASNLHTLVQRRDFEMYTDGELRAHFLHCAVKMTEAGPRIIKLKQTRPIDAVVAGAMSLWGASQDTGYISHPALDEERHTMSLEVLP